MIRARRYRDGLAVEGGTMRWTRPLLAAAIIIMVAGCSAKKPETGPNAGMNPGGEGQSGLGQSGVGGSSGSSLSQFQKGSLGEGEQGPLSDIHFDYDAYTVRPQDGDLLQANAAWMQKNPQTHVQIEGHCDDRGSEEYNLALGARRAQAAKDYLQTLGVAGDRLSTISYGKELPLCTEATEECYAQNRRDHFAVTQ